MKVDEGGDLARSTEFCKVLLQYNVILSTTSGCNSSGNGRGERLYQDFYNFTRIILASNKHIPSTHWCFARLHSSFCVRRLWHNATNSAPFYDFHENKEDYRDLLPWGCPGLRCNHHPESSFDIIGIQCAFLGHSNTFKVVLTNDHKNKKVFRAVHFKPDQKYYSTPTQSLLIGIRNKLSPVPCQQILDLPFNIIDYFSLFDATDRHDFVLPLPSEGAPLNITIIDDEDFHIPILKSITKIHVWHRFILSSFKTNFWIVSIHEEEPITADGAHEAIRFLISKGLDEVKFSFYKRKSCDKTLLEE